MISFRFDSAGRPNSSEDELEASGKDGEDRPDDDYGVGGVLVPARYWHERPDRRSWSGRLAWWS